MSSAPELVQSSWESPGLAVDLWAVEIHWWMLVDEKKMSAIQPEK